MRDIQIKLFDENGNSFEFKMPEQTDEIEETLSKLYKVRKATQERLNLINQLIGDLKLTQKVKEETFRSTIAFDIPLR